MTMLPSSLPFTLPTVPKYANPLPIKAAKLADLKKIVHKYVPTDYNSFYDSITAINTTPEGDYEYR